MKVFVGYDAREDIAYRVCDYSIKKHQPNAEVIPLVQDDLRALGLYWREKDHLASTDFSLTRFLVPALMNYQGWAVFCDCDFLWTEDIEQLFNLRDDSKAVMVVKHDYTPAEGIKMDGQQQHIYPRKNWSSMILWNCAHPSNRYLVPEAVNTETPQLLHRFQWIRDHYIGEVGKEWNWLVNWYKETSEEKPKAIHYTEGGPWFDRYKDCEYANVWNNYKGDLNEQ
jgi:lipopolysaccharide biosynthesis glycosyltransferase